jgi:hypothetical protein
MNGDYRFLMREARTDAVEALSLICLTDTDAMTIARSIGGTREVEVWDGHRLVGYVNARPRSTAGIAA